MPAACQQPARIQLESSAVPSAMRTAMGTSGGMHAARGRVASTALVSQWACSASASSRVRWLAFDARVMRGAGTSVSKAVEAIHAARDEAVAYPNGVGVVNLMGRHSGFIAAHATIAARGVDVCLVPEVGFPLEGEDGLLQHVEARVAANGHCVVVVAEVRSGCKKMGACARGAHAMRWGRMLRARRALRTHYDVASELPTH